MRHPRHAKLGLLLALAAVVPAMARNDGEGKAGADSPIGESFRVPYRLTETNHFLVRARLNGEGPFNLVVDTGAPALFLSEDAAKKAGLKADGAYFTRLDRVEFEGGATLTDVQTRVEDIFQLVGMNALGLPGARIDGMVGFNVLARFRIEIDPTDDRMTWTRLDHEPPDLIVPRGANQKPPAEVQALSMLGGVAKLAAVFVGKQPEDELLPRGFLGLELAETDGGVVTVAGVLPGSPADRAGIESGVRLVRVLGRDVESIADAQLAVSEVLPGDRVTLRIAPAVGDDTDADQAAEIQELNLTAGEGF